MIELSFLWTLGDVRRADPENARLFLRYEPSGKSEVLRRIFAASVEGIELPADKRFRGEVSVLIAEVFARLPAPSPLYEDGLQLKVVEADSFLTHYIGPWATADKVPTLLHWTRHQKIGSDWRPEPYDRTGVVELSALSATSRNAVRQLDAFALEQAYSRLSRKLKESAEVDPSQLPPLRKVCVFLSYRRTHLRFAVCLHQLLSDYASGLAFEPFLDRHDVRLGDWWEQFVRRIAEADIFMPVVSVDYAEDGSVSRREYEHAKTVEAERGLGDFFAPVFLDLANPIAKELAGKHGLPVQSLSDLQADRREVHGFMKTVLAAGLARASGNAPPA